MVDVSGDLTMVFPKKMNTGFIKIISYEELMKLEFNEIQTDLFLTIFYHTMALNEYIPLPAHHLVGISPTEVMRFEDLKKVLYQKELIKEIVV